MSIKAVLFDMDGVLVNTEPLHYRMWQEAFGRRDLEIQYDKYKGCIGATLEYLMNLIWENYGRDFRNDPTLIDDAFQIKREIVEREGYPLVEHAKEMLDKIHEAGFQMAIASSSPPEFIKMAMKNIGVEEYFEVINSAENVAHSKPEPDIYLDTAKKLGRKPEECIVIEDSTNGVLAATRANMICIGFHNPDSGDQDLSPAYRIIEDIRDFSPELIRSLNN